MKDIPISIRQSRRNILDIQIIAGSGPLRQAESMRKGWNCARRNHADLVDEHYYSMPGGSLANHHRYDSLMRKIPGYFGEYASWGNTWYNALIEASYMTGNGTQQ